MYDLYLICNGCGVAFHAMNYVVAFEHGTSDPNTKAWCGDDGFTLSKTREI